MIRLALLLAGISGAPAARPALVHVLHDAGRAALALRGARRLRPYQVAGIESLRAKIRPDGRLVIDVLPSRVSAASYRRQVGRMARLGAQHEAVHLAALDADRAATERALDAALTLSDDCYAPRSGAPCWISDPYAVELAEAEDYAGADRAAEIEGRL